jgi:hypothetical protein
MGIVNFKNSDIMATSKKRNNDLIETAEYVLQSKDIYLLDKTKTSVASESFNGKIASFPVSIAMTGLLPTLAIYYLEKESNDTNLRYILDAIGKMIYKDRNNSGEIFDAYTLLHHAIQNKEDKQLVKDVIDCAIALKQVFRTYII